MKRIYAGMCCLLLAGMIGCTGGTPGGDTTKSKDKINTNIGGPAEGEFTLDVPNFGEGIKQGEEKKVDIGIKRGKDFEGGDVALKFEGVPKGVSIEPLLAGIKKGDEKISITVKASKDAELGDHTIKVIGKPGKGKETTNDFKLTVKK